MKRALILSLTVVVAISLIFMGVGCKGAVEEAVEEVEEAAPDEEAVEEVEEAAPDEEAVEEAVEEAPKTMDEMAIAAAKEIAAGKDVSLNILATWDPIYQAIQQVGKVWEEETGVRITGLEPLGLESLSEKVILEFSTGSTTYDIGHLDVWWHKEIVESGWLADLDPYMEKYDPEWDEFVSGVEEWSLDSSGIHRTLPFYWCTFIMAYRVDLFNDPGNQAAFEAEYGYPLVVPDTFDKYYDVAEFFTDPGSGFYGTAEMFAQYAATDAFLMRYVNEYDGDDWLVDENFEGNCNNAAGIAAMEGCKKIMGSIVPDYLMVDWANVLTPLASGKCAMAFCYAPTWGPLASESEEFEFSGPEKIGFAHIPGKRTQLSGFVAGINAASTHPELAYLFLLWQNSQKYDKEMALTQLSNPVRKTTYQDAEVVSLNPQFAAEFEHLEDAVPIPPHLIFTEEARVISDWVIKYVIGEISTAEEALEGMDNELTEIWDDIGF